MRFWKFFYKHRCREFKRKARNTQKPAYLITHLILWNLNQLIVNHHRIFAGLKRCCLPKLMPLCEIKINSTVCDWKQCDSLTLITLILFEKPQIPWNQELNPFMKPSQKRLTPILTVWKTSWWFFESVSHDQFSKALTLKPSRNSTLFFSLIL